MGGILEGLIAVLGLMAGIMVTIIALVTGEAPFSGEATGSSTHPRTIHPHEERLAALPMMRRARFAVCRYG